MNVENIKFEYLKSVSNPNSIHGIYPYRGKLSALDANALLKQIQKKENLLDPFCGSGTILYEAAKLGFNVFGVDANPIAIQISKGKFDKISVERSIEKVNKISKDIGKFVPENVPEEVFKYFHPETIREILYFVEFFQDNFSDYEKAVFLGTICLVARANNNYNWSSTQIGKISEIKSYVSFVEKFKMKLAKHAYPLKDANSRLYKNDSRRLSDFIEPNSIDIVYTSPPYFDCLDYTSYYTRIIHNIFKNDVKSIKKELIQNFDSYGEDIKKVFEELSIVTKKDALIIFVVGDKKKGNQVINGGEFFSNLFTHKPERVIHREYGQTASKIWDKINNTSRGEQIIIWDKTAW